MHLLFRLAAPRLRSLRPALAFLISCPPSIRTYCSPTMSGAVHNAPGGAGPAEHKKAKKDDGMKELRILMLHGTTSALAPHNKHARG